MLDQVSTLQVPELVTSLLAQAGESASTDSASGRSEIVEALRWLRMPPAWTVVLLILPFVIGFVAFFYRRERPTGSGAWKWVLGALRVVAISIALLMLAQPVRHKRTFEKKDSTLIVLVDDSLSQDIPDRFSDRRIADDLASVFDTSSERIEDTTRYELVRRLMQDEDLAVVEKLRKKANVSIVTFAKSTSQVKRLKRLREDGEEEEAEEESAEEEDSTNEEDDAVDGDGAGENADTLTLDDGVYLPVYSRVREDPRVQETRVAEGLRSAVSGVLDRGFGGLRERVSGVLLFSDFQQNADTISAEDVARRLGERGCPIYTVGVGNPDEPKDVQLLAVDVSKVVLVDDVVPFDVTISADGFEGERVRVDLKFGEVTVKTEYLVLEGGGKRQTLRLEHQPKTPGKFTVTVEVEKLGGEVFPDNNSITKNITVLDQKIKVLYAERLPRWEYRYLKNALIRDQTMEAQIFLFSADPGFPQDCTPGIPALTEFPNTREKLFQYHVIVLGDLDPEEHLGAETCSLLQQFVASGGGVVFIAGPHSNPSRFATSDLYPILPVEVADPGVFEDRKGPVTESFNVKLSPVGREHAVMRLDNLPEKNIALWENDDGEFYNHLPGFYWFAEVGKAKAGSVVLAHHPERTLPLDPDGKPLVIMSFMNYGKGKTFFSAVDATWRWRAGVDNLYFYRFWGQVCRFVASGRLLGQSTRYQISTDREIYNVGDTVDIDARVLDANMSPSDEPKLTIYHQVQSDAGDERPKQIELDLSVQENGEYYGSLPVTRRGRHDIWIGTEEERLAFTSFTVQVPALESRDTRLNESLGRRIAEVSGGEYFPLSRAMDAIEKVQGITRTDDGIIENDDLWDEWWVVVLVTAGG